MKYKVLKKIIRYLLSIIGIVLSIFRRNRHEIIILLYHRINDCWGTELDITIKNFAWQMDYLKRKNYKFISMDDAYNKMIRNEIDDRYIVITFDDGYRDFLTNAYEILKKHEIPSIVFLVPGAIETDEVFWWDKDIGESSLMTWDEIIELNKDNDIDFGSHTLTHRNVDTLNVRQLEYELSVSKEALTKKLNKDIKHFAYPTGVHTKLSEHKIKKYYDTGLLIHQGESIIKPFNADSRARLKRIPIRRSDDKYLFIAKIKGWFVIEDTVKRLFGAP